MSTSEGIDDPWQAFDDALERATGQLERARQRYRQLSALHTLPSSYASALSDLEDEIDAIDDVLAVTEDEAEEAITVADRATLLADVLDTSWTYQRDQLEARLEVYELWDDELGNGERTNSNERAEVREIVRDLAAGDKHGQLVDGEKFTLGRYRALLSEADERRQESVSAKEYVRYCLDAIETFEHRATDDVKALVREEVSISIKDERMAVTKRASNVRDDFEADDCDDESVRAARVALNGAMMLAYGTAVERCSYEHCRRLAEIVDPHLGTDHDVGELVAGRKVHELESIAEEVVVGTTIRPIEERVVDLLEEHDGSLERALAASEFELSEVVDVVVELYLDGTIEDVKVILE